MLDTLFQNPTQQTLRKYNPQLTQISKIGQTLKNFTDDELREKTLELKNSLAQKKDTQYVLLQAFALVREATERVLGLRHFDVQIIGGLILTEGKIAEMKTGEGKSLVALLPTFFYALYGKGTHVITVNDYLAKRDASYVGQVHRFLGLNVGLIQEGMEAEERKKNYNCDVVYVTNNELGFDYLRDNLATQIDELVQRDFFYCLIDEVDSVLIDEARTPLIISMPNEEPPERYLQTSKLSNSLKKDLHYNVDEKAQTITLTSPGVAFCENALDVVDLYQVDAPWISFILNSLKAKELFLKDKNYIINSNQEIVIVDEFTGRIMEGRRWSDGLHQAVEAKENVPIQEESQTVASITYQNLFLLYKTLSGMTGTAKTEEFEFEKIYNLNVIQVPTNKPIKRKDFSDLIYKNQYQKWKAVADECCDMFTIGRPILIGTTTIEKSELLAALLTEYEKPYRLLNAKPENAETESLTIAQAGREQAITIATNMAGRGTDILLGGNPIFLSHQAVQNYFLNNKNNLDPDESSIFADTIEQFGSIEWKSEYGSFLTKSRPEIEAISDPELAPLVTIYKKLFDLENQKTKASSEKLRLLGGLHVIGTERHESRRIDNQLRGRAGRQGDPGSSRFFLSLDDKLLRIFGGDKILSMLQNVGFQDGTPIESGFLNQSLESAQKKVESFYFESRKQLFEYDEALNTQRDCVYTERKRILKQTNLRFWILDFTERSLYDLFKYSQRTSTQTSKILQTRLKSLLGQPLELNSGKAQIGQQVTPETLESWYQNADITYNLKELELELIEAGLLRELEKSFLLQQIDYAWKEHLQRITFLRDSIKWRAFGQKNPLTEYKKEAFNAYTVMLTKIRHRVSYFTFRTKVILE